MAYQSVNPANGEVLRTFDQHTDEELRDALAYGRRNVSKRWSPMSIRERAKIVVALPLDGGTQGESCTSCLH